MGVLNIVRCLISSQFLKKYMSKGKNHCLLKLIAKGNEMKHWEITHYDSNKGLRATRYHGDIESVFAWCRGNGQHLRIPPWDILKIEMIREQSLQGEL